MKIIVYLIIFLFVISFTNAEKQWVQKHYDYNENVEAFKVIDSNRIIALVGDAGYARVYKSYDAGNSWNQTNEITFLGHGDSVFTTTPSYIHDSLNYYFCMMERLVVLKTEDGGETFERLSFGEISSEKTWGMEGIKMYDNNIGCAITFGHVIWTRDNWESYEVVDTPEELYYITDPMFFLDSATIAVKLYRTQSNQFFFFNINDKEWAEYSIEVKPEEGEFTPAIWSAHFLNDTLGIAAGAQRTKDTTIHVFNELIWKTTDKGVHWEIIYKDITYPRFGLDHIDFYENKGIACNSGKIMMSSDYGDTWQYCNIDQQYWRTLFWDCTYCGDYPIVWFGANGAYRYEEVTGITEGIFKEIEVIPHQYNTEFFIEINDPKFRTYEITISDLNGKQISNQTLNTGNSSLSDIIDLNSISNGAFVYFITCNSSLIYTGKFVNVK